ncbi:MULTISPECIES: cytochrome c [unclassified Variovorax]|uniref:c-type cytochrome n=1 Tax=unclassified Variovorax TaxID=663243 RepID=UPI00076C5E34|nr:MULTISPECIES: cytochrome c [unclassified Variovorax]KWT93213.1 putative diheme cytochrome c-553 [Variovorax sp. WDL1]PNG47377.1 Alcohol dehydrogenase cytochrome c subunit [Variovorax sp. B2]PNG47972.1 Alcohol dehydrogenase cytochrome c subunit [Variovorax sp. B4]VTV15282.1 Alcohol dehydrogenase cytochrome c subunit precursor [Variovorax sp. WDL1]
MRRTFYALLALLVLLALAALGLVALNLRGEEPLPEKASAFNPTPAQVERGRYLALAGNCAGCHTARGGAPYAGGVGIETPFGTVFAGNLTPHEEAGIGRWSAAHFWRALHNGRSMDGRLLYPAFPYPSFTRVTREDSDAIYAYLRTVPPAPTPNAAHKLRFPYDTQAALAVWRALFFVPGSFVADPARPAEWNRGAYLVEGLGHCIACHGTRNVLGATEERLGLSGGLIPVENWYAPSLNSKREAGVGDWDTQHVVALLKNGTSPRGSVMGPMADVVYSSTQHLGEADLNAMAVFLKQLPEAKAADTPAPAAASPVRRDAGVMARGSKIYDQQCAYCHGDAGQGAEGAYPALAGSRAVNMDSAVNLVQVLRHGGFLPSTAGNPRPYGMPPFGHVLDDDGIAAVLSYIRGSWGNDAPPVTRSQIMRP